MLSRGGGFRCGCGSPTPTSNDSVSVFWPPTIASCLLAFRRGRLLYDERLVLVYKEHLGTALPTVHSFQSVARRHIGVLQIFRPSDNSLLNCHNFRMSSNPTVLTPDSYVQDSKEAPHHVEIATQDVKIADLGEAQRTLVFAGEKERSKQLSTLGAIRFYWVAFIWAQYF